MKSKYSDSVFPFNIGISFFLTLVIILLSGAISGYLLSDYNFPQAGGIILLIIFVALLLTPLLYNRMKSPFQQDKTILNTYDGIGTMQGLRGALFRLILYKEGIEIRAFYHRYYIPFKKTKNIVIEKGYISKTFNIDSEIKGVPKYIVSIDKKFWEFAEKIEQKMSEQSNETD